MIPDLEFLAPGYFERKENQEVIRAELISKHAKEWGESFAKDRNAQVSSSQLRAFYGDVKALQKRIEEGGAGAFDRYYYQIKMLKSRASYIQGKHSGGRVSEAFRDFIHTCIDAIKTEADFGAFLSFFESTVGFYYGAGGERIR
jgi:CRISPR type III-A-associated protein Csm2